MNKKDIEYIVNYVSQDDNSLDPNEIGRAVRLFYQTGSGNVEKI